MNKNDSEKKKLIIALIFFLFLLLSMCLSAMMSTYPNTPDPEEYDFDPPAINQEDINKNPIPIPNTEVEEDDSLELDEYSFVSKEYGFAINYPENYEDFTGGVYILSQDGKEVLNVADPSTSMPNSDAPWEGFILTVDENSDKLTFNAYMDFIKSIGNSTFVEEDVSFGDIMATKLTHTHNISGLVNISVYIFDSGTNRVIIFSPPKEYNGFKEIYESLVFVN